MQTPALIVSVRFRSRLPFEEVLARARERAPAFAALDGLIEKYYVHDPATDEIGGIYLWASREAFEAYRDSDLRSTIAAAYEVEGEPRVEAVRVLMALRAPAGD